MNEATTTGRHLEERRRRNPWVWLKSKVGKAGAIATVFVLVVAMGAAIAAIMASADIDGQTGTGQVQLDWELDSGGSGPLAGSFAVYDVDDITIINQVATPAGRTCDATVNGDGSLTLAIDGLFPGEGCILEQIAVSNGSTLDVGSFAMTYATDYGTDGSGEQVELWLAAFTGGQFNPVNLAGLADLAPGATYGAGVGTDNWVLIVELPLSSTADGSSSAAAGTALTGQAS